MEKKPLFKQIIHTWLYKSIEFEKVLESVKKVGADGIDLSLDSQNIDEYLNMDIQGLLKRYGLGVYSVTLDGKSSDKDASSPDAKVREDTYQYNKRLIDAALCAGADRAAISHSIVRPSGIAFHTSLQEDWARGVESIRRAAEYAQKHGLMLMIEPVNRYMVKMVHTVEQALKMCDDVGMPNVYVVPDTYHMNIEEDIGIDRVLCHAGQRVKCLHVGDNTRRGPGHGTLDWRSIIGALYDIGFDGPLSHEPVYTAYYSAQVDKNAEDYACFENELINGIGYLKAIMEDIA